MIDIQKHCALLSETKILYERWYANRVEPFNVFTALRSTSDEVNLHSRFLHAVLDRPDSTSGDRENLKAFLDEVCGVNDFSMEKARVEREANHIDLLIKNDHQAVIIENKIWAGDQERQLQRYHDDLRGRGYEDAAIHIFYLTPDGREPEDQSRGEIPPEKITLISYRDKIQDWLVDCQRRAFNEPGLRESIAQYVHLIRRMTNTDYRGEHMNELKKLLAKDNNLVLAKQLSDALEETQAELVQRFYLKVDRMLRERITVLPEFDPKWMNEEEIRKHIKGRRSSYYGLYYRIVEGADLILVGRDRFYLGVECNKNKHPKLYERLRELLADIDTRHRPDNGTPWYQYVDEVPAWSPPGEFQIRDSNESSLQFLAGGEELHAKIAQDIANTLASVWEKIKENRILDL